MWLIRSTRSRKAPTEENYLRAASPNERRCIARESLGFYRALVVGGIYHFSAEPAEVASVFTYAHALRRCVHRHPQLSSAVADADSNSPYYYAFRPRLDLRRHIEILERCDESPTTYVIGRVLESILDTPWSPSVPAWKIVVLPFSEERRCFIAFSFSHALGDGMSGVAFHRTFLDALQEEEGGGGGGEEDYREEEKHGLEKDLTCVPSRKQLHRAFDTSDTLPISWSFLLSPLLGAYLSTWLATLCGFRAAAGSITPGTWTASPFFYNPEKHRTGLETISIDAATVDDVLKICRVHGAKFTALLHQLIVGALSKSLPQSDGVDNFAAQTVLNMRGLVEGSEDEMGNFVSGHLQIYPIKRFPSPAKSENDDDGQDADDFVVDWELAKSTTDQLAAAASRRRDQPIGLLRYLKDMRSWVSSKPGGRRDCSYEVSNLGRVGFQPPAAAAAAANPADHTKRTCSVSVTEMMFYQPADVTGSPLTFNVVSVADGPLSLAVNWQIGALGLPDTDEDEEHEERAFVRNVCQKMEVGIARLTTSSPVAGLNGSK